MAAVYQDSLTPVRCAPGTHYGLSASLSHDSLPRLPYMEAVDVHLTLQTINNPMCEEYVNIKLVISSICEASSELYQYESTMDILTGDVQILSRPRTTPLNDTVKFNVSWQPQCMYVGSEAAAPNPSNRKLSASSSVLAHPEIPLHKSLNVDQLLPPPQDPPRPVVIDFTALEAHRSRYVIAHFDLSHHGSTAAVYALVLGCWVVMIASYFLQIKKRQQGISKKC